MAALKHDHVVTIYQVDADRGVPFLAMEFLAGQPLDRYLEGRGPLPVGEVLRIGREVAEALAAAHATGLIHRDIKPGNIWLEAPRGRVKLLDFGLARAAAQEASLPQAGAIIGTPAYMAPEQARGDPVDARADLFSLGVVLYRLCTGEASFGGTDTISTLMEVATHQPAPPMQLNAGLPPELSDLVMRLLEKDPSRRPATAAAVGTALRALERKRRQTLQKAGAVTGAGPRPAPARARRRLAWWVPALVLLGLVGVGVAALIRFSTEQGDYVIETDDPDFSFRVNREGGVTLTDQKTQRAYALKVVHQEHGEFELETTGAAGDLTFKSRTFTIKRGARMALRAWCERKQPAAAPPEAAADDARLKAIAALPAAKQVEAVAAWLMQRNPGFDGRVTPTIEDGVVTELKFSTHHVTDISPVRALTGLRRLECPGTEEQRGQLADLSPLRGLKLAELDCSNNSLSDLSPLRGMELTVLDIGNTDVADLTPVKGMPLALDASGHTATVTRVFFMPDSKQLVTVSADHSVRTWDALTGQPLKVFYPPGFGELGAAALSPDGKILAVGSAYPDGDKVLRALEGDKDCFFDRQTGELNVYHLQAFVYQVVATESDYKQTPFLKMPLASPPFAVTRLAVKPGD